MLDWISVSALTGQVIARFPDMSCTGALRHVINQYDTATVQFPISSAPQAWPEGVRPGATALIALLDNVPVWGGYVTGNPRSITDLITVPLVSAEGYFARRYVGTVTATAQDQNGIAAELIRAYAGANGYKVGIPIRIDSQPSATKRDRAYLATDFATVYTRLQQLAAVIGGIEFTVDWEWSNATHITPVAHIADRLGRSPNPGLIPAARFFLGPGIGNIISFDYSWSYASSDGANDVTAYSSGQGATTPVSAPQIAPDKLGRPTYEMAYNPGSSIIEVPTLNAYAQATMRLLTDGTSSIAFTADLSWAPALGDVWSMGDDISYDIVHPAVPNGLHGTARAAGYELTDTTITPILAYPVLSEGT